jgi:hypothetical protein
LNKSKIVNNQNKAIAIKASFIAIALFFSMIALPFEVFYLKAILILIIIVSFTLNFTYIKISKFVILWFTAYIIWGFLYLLLGFFNENEGVSSLFSIFFIWPIIYLIFISRIRTLEIFKKLFLTIKIASLFISLYTILYYLSLKTMLINPAIFHMAMQSFDMINPSEYDISAAYITSLMYIVPFNISLLIFQKQQQKSEILFLWLLLILNLITVILVNRNALVIVVVLSPFISLILLRIIEKESFFSFTVSLITFKFFIFIFIFIFITSFFFTNELQIIFDNLILGFQFSSPEAASAYARYEQFFALIEGWKKNIFFGNGIGATLEHFSRNDKYPWAFELSYVVLLFTTGLVGVLFYFTLIFILIKKNIFIAKINQEYRIFIVSTLTGMISFMIANATNPYLYTFEHMWALFTSLAIINVYSYQTNRSFNAKY